MKNEFRMKDFWRVCRWINVDQVDPDNGRADFSILGLCIWYLIAVMIDYGQRVLHFDPSKKFEDLLEFAIFEIDGKKAPQPYDWMNKNKRYIEGARHWQQEYALNASLEEAWGYISTLLDIIL